VCVTVLDGWLSGLAFLPAWVAPLNPSPSGPPRNVFVHPDVVAAEQRLFTVLAQAIGTHPAFLGFDLGNELGVLQGRDNAVTPAEADRWSASMLRHCETVAPGRFHVNGVDHSHWFGDAGFTRANLASAGAASVVHAYPFFAGALERYGYDGAGTLHLVEYMVELARAYAQDNHRPIWVQEFGASSEWMPEAYLPEYAERVIRLAAACQDVWGFTWWCSHDIDPAIGGFASLEYSLGVLDLQNRVKPVGRRLAALAEELRRRPPAPTPRPTALVIPDRGLAERFWPPDWRFATPFMALVSRGLRPSMVLESRAGDTAYLASRGVTRLVTLDEAAAPAR